MILGGNQSSYTPMFCNQVSLQKRTAARKLLMHFGQSDAVAQLSRNLFTGLRPHVSFENWNVP